MHLGVLVDVKGDVNDGTGVALKACFMSSVNSSYAVS